VICRSSGFFKAACNKHWESGKINTVTLEEHEPSVFSIFLTWLELDDIEKAPVLKEIPTLYKEKHSDLVYVHHLLKCYVLGDFLLAEEFQNSVMDLLIAKCQISFKSFKVCTGLDPRSVSYVTFNIPADSLLRRMLYDYWVELLGHENTMKDEIPKEFYHQLFIYVIVAYGQGRKLEAPWRKDRCSYHSHRGQPDQYSCTKK
jgi:hypothetical protein